MLSARLTLISRKQQSLTNIAFTDFIKLYVAFTMLPLFSSSELQVCNAGKRSEDIYLWVLHYIEAEWLIRHSN